MAVELSRGALATMMSGGDAGNPVMQILGHKKIAANGMNERYRLLISDGASINSFAMLATQLNDKVVSGELCDYSVIRINRHIISNVNSTASSSSKIANKRVLIILDLTVLVHGEDVGQKIGDPVPMVDPPESSANNSTAPASIPSQQQQTSSGVRDTPATPVTSSYSSKSGGDVRSRSEQQQTHPISSLNPFQTKWIIKARVTSKSDIRTWSNARGDGKLFSVDLTDESGSIRATAFNDQCDKYFEALELEKVYYFSRCQLKPANKKFTTLTHDFEMTFNNDTQIAPCYEDDSSIPRVRYNLTLLSAIKDLPPESFVDVIGICQSSGDVQSLFAKLSRKELKKRDVTLVDQTLSSVTLTLWGKQAEEFDSSLQPVVAVKGGRITEFVGSKSVGLTASSVLQINPDIPEAHRLRGWYDSLAPNVQFDNVSSKVGGSDGFGKIITLDEVVRSNLGGNPDKADYFNAEAVVMFVVSDRALYQACPNANCMKKVIDQGDGMYRCEKCSVESPKFKYRLMVTMVICDYTGSQRVICFQDVAETILNATAEQIGNSRAEDRNEYDNYFRKILFTRYLFRIRAKMDTFNNEDRLRLTVMSVKRVNYNETCIRILDDLQDFLGVGITESR